MPKKTFLILFAVPFLLMLKACSDDDDFGVIEGSWVRIHHQTNVPLRLEFYGDSLFTWSPMVITDQHATSSGLYVYKDGELTLFGDEDCPEMEGVYTIRMSEFTFDASVKEDECTPRISGITGRWTRETDF